MKYGWVFHTINFYDTGYMFRRSLATRDSFYLRKASNEEHGHDNVHSLIPFKLLTDLIPSPGNKTPVRISYLFGWTRMMKVFW